MVSIPHKIVIYLPQWYGGLIALTLKVIECITKKGKSFSRLPLRVYIMFSSVCSLLCGYPVKRSIEP